MRNVFGDHNRRIKHALEVLTFAEEILKHETADDLTVRAAAVLHDIGIHEAERKYNSSAGNYQEIEGPSIAEKIMKKLKINNEVIEHAGRIIGSHHSAKGIDTTEFRIIWDADWIVNISDEYPDVEEDKISKLIERTFKTKHGKKIALRKYTNKN
jgi:putative nucleotidyltransferase with HDIG domain